ncbi:LysR family transcriptional regulator [Nocardia carnea]|nr:LysR family transcriptional regulator [Nocardia carnea]
MERHEIEAFLTLAEELHFRRTSEKLGLAQGRVSQTIRKLEQRIGAQLFERTSRSVSLTPIGRRLRDDLAPAFRQIREAEARAIASGKGISGSLHVGFSTPWVDTLVIRAADLFQDRHPDCTVQIREVQLSDPFGALREGELDLQLTEFPVAEPDLVAGPVIFSEPRALIVPAGNALARRPSASVEELASGPLISVSGDVPRYWLDHHYPDRTPQGRPIPRGPRFRYWQEALALVEAGRGITVAAVRAGTYYSRPGIVFVPLRDAPPIEYGLIRRRTGDTRRVQTFISLVCELAGVFEKPRLNAF